jgi:hypothetical protein
LLAGSLDLEHFTPVPSCIFVTSLKLVTSSAISTAQHITALYGPLNFEAPSFIIEKGRKEARKGGKEDVERREEGRREDPFIKCDC